MRIRQQVNGTLVDLEFRVTGREVEYRILDASAAEVPFRRADVVEAEQGVYSILAGGRSFDIRLEHAHYGTVAQHRSSRVLLEKVSRTRRTAGASGSGPLNVKAAMPGRVVRVLVAEGDRVNGGQGLVVLEAMKMQNEIAASREGVVRRLTAQEGKVVAAGELLCVLE
jgi:biotin carboxyl carrier protein